MKNINSKRRVLSAAITCLVIVVVIVVNILLGSVGSRLNIDFTKDRVLAFSDQTVETLKGLDKDVKVYLLMPDMENTANQVDAVVVKLNKVVEKYQTYNSKIKCEKIDPNKNPQFIETYQKEGEQLNPYSIIVECGDKYRVIDINNTFISTQSNMIDSLNVEQLLTSAIAFVSSDVIVKAAVTIGHGEMGELDTFDYVLSKDNYTSSTIDLETDDIADDISIIVIPSPQIDFTEEEIAKLNAYSEKGGKIQVFRDVGEELLPNFDAFLASWGVQFVPGFVIDTNQGNYIQGPIYLLPNLGTSDITNALATDNYRVMIPFSRAINITKTEGINSESLMSSSPGSLIKINPESQTTEKEEGDTEGPATIGALLTKKIDKGTSAQMLVIGNTYFLKADYIDNPSFANKDFYLKAVAVMSGNDAKIDIKSKDVSVQILSISSRQMIIYSAVVVIVIPLCILIFGIVVWLKRRHL